MKTLITLVTGRAGLKLFAILALCFASLGLYNSDGRYVVTKQNILPNLDFADLGAHWSGAGNGISIKTSQPPVLSLSNKAGRQALLWQTLDSPGAYRNIRIGADVKIDNVTTGANWWNQAGIVLLSIDEGGAKMPYWPSKVALLSGSAPWQRHEVTVPVADNAKKLQFSIFLIDVPGNMFVRNITVDALDPAHWFTVSRDALIALWIGIALWIVTPLLVRKRRNVAAYGALIVFVVTLAGVLTPQPHLANFLESAQSGFDRVATPVLPDRMAAPEKKKPAVTSPSDKSAPADSKDTGPAISPSTQVIAALPSSVKRGGGSFAAHFVVHAALAFLVLLAFGEAGTARVLVYLIVTAAVTEIIQIFIITRSSDYIDGTYNVAGVGAGVAACLLWRAAVRRVPMFR